MDPELITAHQSTETLQSEQTVKCIWFYSKPCQTVMCYRIKMQARVQFIKLFIRYWIIREKLVFGVG